MAKSRTTRSRTTAKRKSGPPTAKGYATGGMTGQRFSKAFNDIVDNSRDGHQGQDDVVRLALVAILCEGHILFEDVPGTGKSMLARAIAQSMNAERQPHPVHARHAPRRHHRLVDPRPEEGRLRVPARPGLRQRPARRRDQPGHAEDAVGAARGHGRAPGLGRRRHLRPAPSVPRARHAEPHRAGRHVPAARGPARPLPLQADDGLHGPRVRVRGHVRQLGPARDRGPRLGHRHEDRPADDRLRLDRRGLRRTSATTSSTSCTRPATSPRCRSGRARVRRSPCCEPPACWRRATVARTCTPTTSAPCSGRSWRTASSSTPTRSCAATRSTPCSSGSSAGSSRRRASASPARRERARPAAGRNLSERS